MGAMSSNSKWIEGLDRDTRVEDAARRSLELRLAAVWHTLPMAAHLAEISQAVDPGAHAVLMLDQAGWHLSKQLIVPDNITVVALPPKCPELNPAENVWQFLRENWLSNRVFTSYDCFI